MQHAVRELESSTAACTGFLLNICLSYGGRAEILSACSSMVAEIVSRNSGNSSSSEATSLSNVLVTEEDFSRHLCTKDIPGRKYFPQLICLRVIMGNYNKRYVHQNQIF